MEREREAAIECSQCGADIRGRRFCIACGAPVISEDATIAGGWTTSTGHETVRGTVPRVSGAPFQSRQEQHAFVTDEAPAVPVPSVGGRGRSRKGPILVGTVLALTLIGAAVLGYLWLDAASNRDAIRTTLATTAADLNVARQANDQLEADLADSKALATRRAALLSQTERVLRAVDPLLSSVDELQGIASEIQTARTSYADASSVLKSDLIALANYLLDLDDPAYADWSWVNSMISDINGEISTVNYYGGSLTDHDGRYGEATQRFDTRATSLNESVRALQKKLKGSS